MSHPKWKYHASRPARVVSSEAEEKELGPEWAESPAKFGVISCPSQDQNGVSYHEYMAKWVSKEEQQAAAKEVPAVKPEKKPAKAKV